MRAPDQRETQGARAVENYLRQQFPDHTVLPPEHRGVAWYFSLLGKPDYVVEASEEFLADSVPAQIDARLTEWQLAQRLRTRRRRVLITHQGLQVIEPF